MTIAMRGLIVFAKKPLLGRVKTRLQPEISLQASLELYRSFVEDTLEKATSLPGAGVWLGCFPDSLDPWFQELAFKYPLRLFNQEGPDLGRRMESAFHFLNHQNYKARVIIGTDTPHLPAGSLEEAFYFLETYPVVIGPSDDGGYYLIGVSGEVPDIFKDIAWSTGAVFHQTVRRLKENNLPFKILSPLFDIDYFQDLLRLKSHLSALKQNGAEIPKKTWLTLETIDRLKEKVPHE